MPENGTAPAAYPVPRFTQCPPPPQDPEEPAPGNLAYGLALPSAVATPSIAREAAEVILDVHGVADTLIDPALRLVPRGSGPRRLHTHFLPYAEVSAHTPGHRRAEDGLGLRSRRREPRPATSAPATPP
ncbi:hypothetical protein ACIQ7D_16905 [Streptomyces sp. NPDC096310]|uniref:hypothetical protein n=1 Tax=Streptomyces sp. NPDC096310 TaxID=3366082 RepID=UPI0038192B84